MTLDRIRNDLARIRSAINPPPAEPGLTLLSDIDRARALCRLFCHYPETAPEGFDPAAQLARLEGGEADAREAAAQEILAALRRWKCNPDGPFILVPDNGRGGPETLGIESNVVVFAAKPTN